MTLDEELAALSPSDFWQTPLAIFDRVLAFYGGSYVDPCPPSPSVNGLSLDWSEWAGGAYVNPPYSRTALPRWTAKCRVEAEQGCEILALLPASTGAQWWVRDVWQAATALCFVTGRIRFINPETGTQHGCGRMWSALVYYGTRRDRFFDVFRELGEMARLRVGDGGDQ